VPREVLDRLVEELRGDLEIVDTKLDEFAPHVSHTAVLRRGGLELRFVTGWQTCVELIAGDVAGAAVGDQIHALDWGIDNFGPEGVTIAFNGVAFLLEGNGYVQAECVPAAGERARAFARAIVDRIAASSLQALVQAVALLVDPLDVAGSWRLGNLAAATEQTETVRWSERERAFVTGDAR